MDTLLYGICGEDEKVNGKVSDDSSDNKEGRPLEAEMTEEDEAVDHDPTEDVQRKEPGLRFTKEITTYDQINEWWLITN